MKQMFITSILRHYMLSQSPTFSLEILGLNDIVKNNIAKF